jgi:predicted RNA-binding Zn-ribbon protein involved in translation (DUF1610 family)
MDKAEDDSDADPRPCPNCGKEMALIRSVAQTREQEALNVYACQTCGLHYVEGAKDTDK